LGFRVLGLVRVQGFVFSSSARRREEEKEEEKEEENADACSCTWYSRIVLPYPEIAYFL
jgi:hypothetical protein